MSHAPGRKRTWFQFFHLVLYMQKVCFFLVLGQCLWISSSKEDFAPVERCRIFAYFRLPDGGRNSIFVLMWLWSAFNTGEWNSLVWFSERAIIGELSYSPSFCQTSTFNLWHRILSELHLNRQFQDQLKEICSFRVLYTALKLSSRYLEGSS